MALGRGPGPGELRIRAVAGFYERAARDLSGVAGLYERAARDSSECRFI
ncbi:hypothetical protein [Sporosarcina sp. Te-1]|nr:hypothetical protein [Sporosarcina sp. Te-1]QTD39579.1 hypothetical protein J3U78_12020 [Sporosarcina sp. Te-1]